MRCVRETNRAKFVVSVHVGRNVNELSQASLCNSAVVNLPLLVKPETYREATTTRSDMAARGRMGWHAWRGKRMNKGSPNGLPAGQMSRVADMPVVLKIIRTT